MLIPTQISGSTIVWHYLINKDFTWMSHNEAEKACGRIAKVDFDVFETATTHLIGWVTSSHMNTGRTGTVFDTIEYTGDDVVGSGYAIDGLTVNVAKYLGASIYFTPAQKDSRLMHAPVPFYERMINTASSMDVIFYDTTTRRAWLVGGDDALLYLSRAAISHPEGRTPKCHHSSSMGERFYHADSMAPKSCTSQDVLLHEDNRDLAIYDNKRDPSKRWRFEDEVAAMFDVLGEMAARRAKFRKCETKQWEMRNPWSKQFIGIGCLDLISGQQTLRPRCRDLNSASAYWLKMADAIDSVNIIGAGLAEMIQPTTKDRSFTELPTGQDILIAPMRRINRIARMYGTRHSDCIEITRGVFWQDPMASFHASPCRCNAEEAMGCSERPIVNLRSRRQTFLRGLRKFGVSLDRLLEMYPTSAVAFGCIEKSPESRSMVAGRTSTAIFQFLHPATSRASPMQVTNGPYIVPKAPPTPGSSPSRTTQPYSMNDRGDDNSPSNAVKTTTSTTTICTPSKAAQIWLLLMVGNCKEAESLIRLLLQSGFTVEHIDETCNATGHRSNTTEDLHESLLGFACRSGDFDCDFDFLQFLVHRQFPADKTNSLGISPLEEAVSLNHVRAMRELLGSYTTLRLDGALMIAVRAGSEDATGLLLEHGHLHHRDLPLDQALQEACDAEHIQLAHLLIASGADPNVDYAKVFRNALASGSPNLVEALLQHDIDESLVLAMTDALEDLNLQPGKCREGSAAKLSHLRRKCVEIRASDGLEFLDLSESEDERC